MVGRLMRAGMDLMEAEHERRYPDGGPFEVVAEPDDDPEPSDEDLDGPEGNHGAVTCAVCEMTGWLMSANERGFLIRHDTSPFPHRAPR